MGNHSSKYLGLRLFRAISKTQLSEGLAFEYSLRVAKWGCATYGPSQKSLITVTNSEVNLPVFVSGLITLTNTR